MAVRLLDTNIVSFLMKSHPRGAQYLPHLTGHDLAVSFQTIAELLAGGALAGWGDAKWAALDATLASMTVLHSDQATCARWAEIRVARQTQPIAVADCWIAATALAYGLELVTHNPADFQGIPGLAVITEAP
ncbi:MAG: PIN domain-containing protein [Gemmataceae bacterium]